MRFSIIKMISDFILNSHNKFSSNITIGVEQQLERTLDQQHVLVAARPIICPGNGLL